MTEASGGLITPSTPMNLLLTALNNLLNFTSSEPMPKEFEKTTEVLPFTKYGLSSMQEFKEAEGELHDLLWLKNAGLTYDEIKLYQANEAGLLDQQKKVEANAMKEKLEAIYSKMKKHANDSKSSSEEDVKPGTSKANQGAPYKDHQKPLSTYPEGHPMNCIKEIEVDLFGHLHTDDITPLSKRRKMLRRFERKKNRVLAHEKQVCVATCGLAIPNIKGRGRRHRHRLWDMEIEPPIDDPFQHNCILHRDRTPRNWCEHYLPPRNRNDYHPGQRNFNEQPECWRNRKIHHGPRNRKFIGPRNKKVYSIRDNKIVRVKQVIPDQNEDNAVVPENPEVPLEEQLLEGTKMSVDNIKRIERFKDYDPGVPSKMLYLKNIAPEVSQEQVSLLFNQFVLANGGPIGVRLMTAGRMRGQAFVEFQEEEICIQALSEANGTILSGQPVIAQFARTNDRPRPPDNR